MGMGIVARFMKLERVKVDVGAQEPELNEEEYLELARKAGFDGATKAIALKKSEAAIYLFRAFLAENGITVYQEDAVNRYMNSITPFEMRWGWLGLDSSASARLSMVYEKPIPLAVLMTMAKIREAFPDAVFQVADIYYLPKGDPFLRVALSGTSEWFIIERWDEPGFRM